MNTIHIPKAIKNKVEVTNTHVLVSRKLMKSEAMVSKMLGAKGHPKWSLANLQLPLTYLRMPGEQVNHKLLS